MSGATRKVGALVAPCDGCGAANGILFENRHGHREYQCPKCTQKMALWGAGMDHMTVLFREALEVFKETWGNVPVVMSSLGEMTWHAGMDIGEEIKEQKAQQPAEEVQPLRLAEAAD